MPRLALCWWCARKNTNFADPGSAGLALTHFRGRRKLLKSASMPDTATVNDNKNKQLIDMLRRSRLFRDYENVFTKATGLPLALRPLEYWQLEHHQKTNENPFCALLARRPKTLTKRSAFFASDKFCAVRPFSRIENARRRS